MDNDITVDKNELRKLCKGLINNHITYEYQDGPANEYRCICCGVDTNLPEFIWHKLDCPVLIAISLCPKD